ncbi:MAG TPA: GxxExxY protein [Terriglobales bacterium]|jgi:GxxExxY protein|nr:GxxExxY protein [Terriglobales bacterium]
MNIIVMPTATQLNAVTEQIIGAAMEVHRTIGPGLLESAYEACLAHELRERGFRVEQQKPLPVIYKGVRLDCGYRLDMVINESVIVEIKAVEKLTTVHDAQLLSYLRLLDCRVGLLLNFHCTMLKNGIRRIVNDFPISAASAISAVK